MGEWSRRVFPMVSHLPDSWPVAAGLGLASALRGDSHVTIAFCGDGATSTGAWHETLNFAAVFNTPNAFVVENNGWAYSTPVHRQHRAPSLAARAAAYGLPGIHIDGNDAIAVHEAAGAAIDHARAGGGPTLIETVTMRMRDHAGHDNADYVPPAAARGRAGPRPHRPSRRPPRPRRRRGEEQSGTSRAPKQSEPAKDRGGLRRAAVGGAGLPFAGPAGAAVPAGLSFMTSTVEEQHRLGTGVGLSWAAGTTPSRTASTSSTPTGTRWNSTWTWATSTGQLTPNSPLRQPVH
jgi:hypothetical protein